MLDHFGRRVPVVGMLVSTPEYGINDVPSPGHLKRLGTENFFVGRLDAMALGRIIVVHDHGVETQNDDRRFAHFEPPEKKLKK